MYIAATIVPWTVEWLAAYEGWRATGTWYAGGPHTTKRFGDKPARAAAPVEEIDVLAGLGRQK